MRGAFVVQLGNSSQPAQNQFEGWVEEVDSGKQLRFRSTEELLQFLSDQLQQTLTTKDKHTATLYLGRMQPLLWIRWQSDRATKPYHNGGSKRRKEFAMNATYTGPRTDPFAELELIRAAKQGDVDAFEQLVQRYSGVVFRVALHIARSREDAEEIAQETFLRAFRHLSSFEERARISTWLTRIAVNAALVKMRGLRPTETVAIAEQPAEDEIVAQQIADRRPNPEQLYRRQELSALLRVALESLPNGYSEVFWLRDVEGFSIAETAETLGISEPAVKTRLLRARLQLRERLSQHFPCDGNTTDTRNSSVSGELLAMAT